MKTGNDRTKRELTSALLTMVERYLESDKGKRDLGDQAKVVQSSPTSLVVHVPQLGTLPNFFEVRVQEAK